MMAYCCYYFSQIYNWCNKDNYSEVEDTTMNKIELEKIILSLYPVSGKFISLCEGNKVQILLLHDINSNEVMVELFVQLFDLGLDNIDENIKREINSIYFNKEILIKWMDISYFNSGKGLEDRVCRIDFVTKDNNIELSDLIFAKVKEKIKVRVEK
jgi:hypothetical protein